MEVAAFADVCLFEFFVFGAQAVGDLLEAVVAAEKFFFEWALSEFFRIEEVSEVFVGEEFENRRAQGPEVDFVVHRVASEDLRRRVSVDLEGARVLAFFQKKSVVKIDQFNLHAVLRQNKVDQKFLEKGLFLDFFFHR